MDSATALMTSLLTSVSSAKRERAPLDSSSEKLRGEEVEGGQAAGLGWCGWREVVWGECTRNRWAAAAQRYSMVGSQWACSRGGIPRSSGPL